ncbi:hypothetical protein Ccrd_022559 [Cynara cardunculus var. scolymus]|uniref:Amino acid transporter transmembrane domain-containing protein n=1 Tax=Cynara cardunculus var. scolymus TaxID=59895 RepID=A0A103XYE2_CYNCS|nr:hypothetical protein Ccrd_022559 [Cynara cardunculus var. scolymus]
MARVDCNQEEEESPLLQTSHQILKGFQFLLLIGGNIWTALAHFIAGVIGSGVLSMAWSIAQLGWIAGPLSIILIAFFALVSAFLISNFHVYPNPTNGNTTMNRSFLQAVHTILGEAHKHPFASCLYLHLYFGSQDIRTDCLFKTGVVYVITSATCIRQSNCYHEEGHEAACEYENKYYMLLFGIVQLLASQIPNIFHTKWLSIIAATMSFTYSFIGIGLGLAQVIGRGKIEGSINGISTANPTQKVWLVAQAIGDIAFSFTFSLILLEIQSTLKSPPSQKVTMKRTCTIAIFITTSFYLLSGASGYAAFGDSTPGNILTGFGFYEPYWLVDFGNACIVLHLVGGYQTLFAIAERWYAEKFPESALTSDIGSLKVLGLPKFRVNPLRLCFRSTYVISTMAVGMLFPYFNEVLAFSGSIIFWPLTIYFPVEMYIVQQKIVGWSSRYYLIYHGTMAGAGGDYDDQTPLLPSSPHTLTGNVWTAIAHIITGVIGSGVLSLAWSMAQLGWIAGPFTLLLFAFITLVSASFISDVHLYSNPNNGTTTMNRSYLQAVRTILESTFTLLISHPETGSQDIRMACYVVACIFKTGVVYTITSAISMRAIRQSNCYHEEGHDAVCEYDDKYYMLLFGFVQILASQIPNIFHTKWLSVIAATMSFTYSFIGMALGIAQVIGQGKIEGSINGISTVNHTQKIWLVAQALGDIAFSFTFSLILLEIQIYSQTLFAIVERWYAEKFPESVLTRDVGSLKVLLLPEFRVNPLRLCFRTTYVVLTMAVGMLFPYFNEVVAFAGSIIFWPLTIYFPVEMYFVQKKIVPWTGKWIVLRVYSTFCLLVTIYVLSGSIEGLIAKRFG